MFVKSIKLSIVFAISLLFSFVPDIIAQTDSSYSKPGSSLPAESSISDSDTLVNLADLSVKAEKKKPDVPAQYLPKWHSMITNIPNDFVRYYDAELTKENLPYFMGVTVATLALIATDDATWKASDKFYKQSSFNKNMSDIFTDYGDGRSQFALAGLFAAYGLIDNNTRALRTASQIVEAVLASGAVVQVLKHLTGRESPFISAMPGGAWRFFPSQIEYHKHVAKYDAFPSGHVTTSLAAVIVVSENYPEHKWIKPVGYTFTALLGIGMANKGIHWYSDYPLAIALGYAFGKLIAHPEEETNTNKVQENGKKVSYRVSPYINNAGTGLSFSVHF
ncbi:MAG: phosphatase PAP2 family protein [Bacillota bacterium]